jgi:hypothetical protein
LSSTSSSVILVITIFIYHVNYYHPPVIDFFIFDSHCHQPSKCCHQFRQQVLIIVINHVDYNSVIFVFTTMFNIFNFYLSFFVVIHILYSTQSTVIIFIIDYNSSSR